MSDTDKRHRRTKAQMQSLLDGVLNILGEYDERITVRHLFYRCANAGLIDKTTEEYNSLRGHLVKWRRAKLIAYSAFIDGTRWHYGAETFNGLGEYLRHAAASYRLNLWAEADCHPEIWVEKEAVASMVFGIAQEWNLKVFVARGDASMSSLADAAETFNLHRADGKAPIILYLGDYDENGLAIPKTIERNLLKDHDCEVQVTRVAINQKHIAQYGLPTRPPKGKRRGEAVEHAVDIDAMKPRAIRELLTAQIETLIDYTQLVRLKAVEEAERETLRQLRIA
jgi:hypothetical protein